jgi:hypothetical protein
MLRTTCETPNYKRSIGLAEDRARSASESALFQTHQNGHSLAG